MKKLTMQTPDLTEGNVTKIAQLFPNVITEKEGSNGVVEKAVDFELLKQMLSRELVEDDNERYRLDWPGKKDSLLKANTPITSTLRPDRDSSVNFDATENVFIEGDNFEVLKVLQESYLGKVKMIYIDPPYNTGKDFVYKDNFTKNKDEYEEDLGVEDEEGGKLFRNTDTNGRFHSDWLSMMYERLLVARDLLTEDGIIFVSIDDNEVTNLKKICDEVFGEQNFLAQIVRRRRNSQANLSKDISPIHEYVVTYKKSDKAGLNKVTPVINTDDFKNPDGDFRGSYVTMPCTNKGGSRYEITTPTGVKHSDEWRFKIETYENLLKDNRLVFPSSGNGKPRYKLFLSEKMENGVLANTWFDEVASNQEGTIEVKDIFETEENFFDNPKPIGLLKKLMELSTKTDEKSIILDFFAGSGTTAHAVMDMNAKDGGNRQFVMVQISEEIDKDSDVYAAGYKYISDISKERIRRAGKKILEENAEAIAFREKPLDIGFRAYKADTTNMKDVYYHPSQVVQDDLFNLVSNIKEDRTPEDLLTQVILDLGLTLDLPVEKKELRGNSVYFVAGNALVACFDDKIDFGIVDDIATHEPLKVVFKDASFKEEQDRTNVDTRMKRLSPETIITVL